MYAAQIKEKKTMSINFIIY